MHLKTKEKTRLEHTKIFRYLIYCMLGKELQIGIRKITPDKKIVNTEKEEKQKIQLVTNE